MAMLLLLVPLEKALAFVTSPSQRIPAPIRIVPSMRSLSSCSATPQSSSDDGAASGGGEKENDEMQSLLASLKSRQEELLRDQQTADNDDTCTQRVRQPGQVASRIGAALPDWVRRIAVDYPLVACGSASSTIYLAHLETGEILATGSGSDSSSSDTSTRIIIDEDRIEHVVQQLYGQYDGGGTLAIGMSKSNDDDNGLICSASRTGGVTLHRWIRTGTTTASPTGNDKKRDASSSLRASSMRIIHQGTLQPNDLVTTLQVTFDYLLVGTDRGLVTLYDLDDDLPLRTTPDRRWHLPNAPICTGLAVHEALSVAAVATDSGAVYLLALDEEDHPQPMGSFTPPFDGTERRAQNAFPTSVAFVECTNKAPIVNKKMLLLLRLLLMREIIGPVLPLFVVAMTAVSTSSTWRGKRQDGIHPSIPNSPLPHFTNYIHPISAPSRV
jgi:hypothetical protein